jgi:site-specific DNA recombinase
MLRAFLYARYSTDLQSERSIDDQIAIDRAYCGRRDFLVAGIFADRAISGASIVNRPDYLRMVALAAAGECDVIVAEDLDRLSRNLGDVAKLYEQMTFARVAIETIADGLINEMHIGLKGTMNAIQLGATRIKIRRGMAGVVRDGRHPGGLAYGYRPIAGKPGELEIEPQEAAIVQRIFREYADGRAPRAIAAGLNAEGAAAPRQTYWLAPTINGHNKRKSGILQNELYAGRLVWNRVRMVKNPATGKRLSRPLPESEWQRSDAPHLRIVDDDLFDQVQRRRVQRALAPRNIRGTPKRILSGLLRCGACGAGMSKKDIDHGRPRIVCTRMREASSCSNRRAYYLDDIERTVIGGLRAELGTREAVAYFVRCYNEERRRRASGGQTRRQALERELAAVDRQVERAVKAVIDGRITEAEAAAHLPALRGRRAALVAELEALGSPATVVALRPVAVDRYIADLEHLEEMVNAGLAQGIDAAANAIRGMIETVTVEPAPRGQAPDIIVRGELGGLLGLDPFETGRHSGGQLVAEEGLEPPTHGL